MDKKMLLVIIAMGVVMLLIMGGGFFLMWTKMSAMAVATQPKGEGHGAAQAAEDPNKVLRPTLALEPLVVNLADEGGKRYLRVTMELEMEKPELEEELKKRLTQVRNIVLMILPEKRFDDIRTTEGKAALREEIMGKVNPLLTKGKLTNIYYTEFVVQ